MNGIIVTNNELVFEKYKDTNEVEYLKNYKYIDVLKHVRNKVQMGHKLHTHPLSGSIKPNETPYKSIVISKSSELLDMKSLLLIEESVLTTIKFLNNKATPLWTQEVLKDFRTIDLSLIQNSINVMNSL